MEMRLPPVFLLHGIAARLRPREVALTDTVATRCSPGIPRSLEAFGIASNSNGAPDSPQRHAALDEARARTEFRTTYFQRLGFEALARD
jgi:hypothetical protein